MHCVAVAAVDGGVVDNDDVPHGDGDAGSWDHQCWLHHSLHKDYRNFLGTHFQKTSKIPLHCPDLKIEEGVECDVSVDDFDVAGANIGELQLSRCCHFPVVPLVEHVSAVAAHGLAELVAPVQ